jgi:LacI family fructose operon transcriptional repressor
MARQGLPADTQLLPAEAEPDAAIRAMLAGWSPPEAVLAANSLLLMGALRAARRAGLVVPQDLALAGFDNEPWTELVEPGLTVIEQPLAEIGRVAMALLFDRLRTPAAPARRVMLSGRCILRGSTAPRGQRGALFG